MPAILLIKRNENAVPDSPSKWRAGQVIQAFDADHVFGTQEQVAAGHFYHITITDRAKEQVAHYIQDWRHSADVQQIQANGNQRRIEVTSDMVAAGGGNAFVRVDVEELLTEIGGTYVSHTSNSFRFDIVADISQRDEIMATIADAVRNMQYARRRWYITAAGMSFLAGNGGVVSGTAAQVSGYLRDGLLD